MCPLKAKNCVPMRGENVAFNGATKVLEMQMSTAENTSIFPKKFKEGAPPAIKHCWISGGFTENVPPQGEFKMVA